MKNRRKAKQNSWPPILTRTYPSGKSSFVIDVMVRGQRIRETFGGATGEKDAATRAAQLRLMRANEGAAAFSVSPETRLEALRASQALTPHGATISEAVHHYVDKVLRFREAPTVADAVKRLLAEKEQKNLRPSTMVDLRHRWDAFASEFADRKLSDVRGDEIAAWLAKTAKHPVNRHNYRRKVFSLYALAMKRKWCAENVVEQTERPEFARTTPGILSVPQVASLLACADDFGMMAFAALGFFAGVRPDELRRLRWGAVHIDRKQVVIGSDVAKVKEQRILPLNETALAWVKECKDEVGRMKDENGRFVVSLVNFRKQFDAWRLKAGVAFPSQWPRDCVRHTFGTYHFAAYKDAVETSRLMGHVGQGIFFQHYRALTDEETALRFWALRPSSEADSKIVAMR